MWRGRSQNMQYKIWNINLKWNILQNMQYETWNITKHAIWNITNARWNMPYEKSMRHEISRNVQYKLLNISSYNQISYIILHSLKHFILDLFFIFNIAYSVIYFMLQLCFIFHIACFVIFHVTITFHMRILDMIHFILHIMYAYYICYKNILYIHVIFIIYYMYVYM